MKTKAIELFIQDAKHKRTLAIIEALLDGAMKHREIADKYGVSRRAVLDIQVKYIK